MAQAITAKPVAIVRSCVQWPAIRPDSNDRPSSCHAGHEQPAKGLRRAAEMFDQEHRCGQHVNEEAVEIGETAKHQRDEGQAAQGAR